jgi:hypothetical protein
MTATSHPFKDIVPPYFTILFSRPRFAMFALTEILITFLENVRPLSSNHT